MNTAMFNTLIQLKSVIKRICLFLIVIGLLGCPLVIKEPAKKSDESQVQLIVLGNVQDAGSPHIGCKKVCCKKLFKNPNPNRQVVSLGLIDNDNHTSYLFEATPDISRQLKTLRNLDTALSEMPSGIFLTHAHIGHYSGLMYLGKEATSAHCVPVYAMPRMNLFLNQNGPWSQLVLQENIEIKAIENQKPVHLSEHLSVTPFLVPHRDEYSETVGYTIQGRNKSALFIPDIDKWEKWDSSITDAIAKVDYAFIDATFYDGDEIKSRDISEIPHPFVIESMGLMKDLSPEEKAKVYFIHLNHTNPLLNHMSPQSKVVRKAGFNIAKKGDEFSL
jgi:pyrroloquinoline quinone biosynthesis protein B